MADKVHKRRWCCTADESLIIESLVVVLTVTSCLATAGRILMTMGFIAVDPDDVVGWNSTNQEDRLFQTNKSVNDLVMLLLELTVFGVAAFFTLEVLTKMAVMRSKFTKNPWQIFDLLVVLASLGVAVTFHFIDLPFDLLHAVSFVVVLRLWRLNKLCHTRKRQARRALLEDEEGGRGGQEAAQQRAEGLEQQLRQQTVTISILENTLKRYQHNQAEVASLSTAGHRLNPSEPFTAADLTNTSTSTNKTTHNRKSKNRKDDDDNPNHTVIEMSQFKVTSGPALSASLKKRIKHEKLRKRRSSTNELTDYSHLSSPEAPSYEDAVRTERRRNSSCPSLPDLHDQRGLLDESDSTEYRVAGGRDDVLEYRGEGIHDNIDIRGIKKCDSSTSDASSGVSSDVSSRRDKSGKKGYKRFVTSCPDIVLDKGRMSVTDDDAKLIDEEAAMYDNQGFIDDEKVRRAVMAEFDGTKTYRSVDGIPMTSL